MTAFSGLLDTAKLSADWATLVHAMATLCGEVVIAAGTAAAVYSVLMRLRSKAL